MDRLKSVGLFFFFLDDIPLQWAYDFVPDDLDGEPAFCGGVLFSVFKS